MNILVTGGAGYIGSHTLIELIDQKIGKLFSIDNYLNSEESNYNKIEKITGQKINYFNIDLKDKGAIKGFLTSHAIDSVIHFAALKSVPESVESAIKITLELC